MDLFREYEDGNDEDNHHGKGVDNLEIRLQLLKEGHISDATVTGIEDDIKSKCDWKKL